MTLYGMYVNRTYLRTCSDVALANFLVWGRPNYSCRGWTQRRYDMRHKMLTQRALFCHRTNTKRGTLSQHFVTHVVPPLGWTSTELANHPTCPFKPAYSCKPLLMETSKSRCCCCFAALSERMATPRLV